MSPEALRELELFLEPFAGPLPREENRRAMRAYVRGLVADLPRKTATALATVDETVNSQSLQEFLTRSPWDRDRVDRQRLELLREIFRERAALAVGLTSIRKRGSRSVGVARQRAGDGRPANRQVLVSLAHAGEAAEWPITSELYLPERWVEDEALREEAGIPEKVGHRSFAEIALQQIDTWATSTAEPVIAGPSFGEDEAFVGGLRDRGHPYLLERRGAPEAATDEIPPAGEDGSAWARVAWWERGWGTRVRDILPLPLPSSPRPGEWVVALRQEDACRVRRMRWFRASDGLGMEEVLDLLALGPVCTRVESRCRSRFGLDDYQGRLWDGFHNHLTLVRLAYTFALLEEAREPGDELA